MMGEEIDRIVIMGDGVYGDLFRCGVCGVNFTAGWFCVVCGARGEREFGVGLGMEEVKRICLGVLG